MTIDATTRARVLGIETTYVPTPSDKAEVLPQQIGVFAQGNTASVYASTKFKATRHIDVATKCGWGSPLHLAARELLPDNLDGANALEVWFYPMSDGGSAVAAAGSITPIGTVTAQGTFKVGINGIFSNEFTVPVSASVSARTALLHAAISAILHMPMTSADASTVVNCTAKWKGPTGNDLKIEVVGPTDTGAQWNIVQPTGGSVTPDISPFLAQMGPQWITMAINGLGFDSTTLDKIKTFVDGRWGDLVRKPLVFFTGTNVASVATAITVPDGRKLDFSNSQIPAPGSKNLPIAIAARGVSRMAVLANLDPANDFPALKLTGITPGTDAEQWDFPLRQQAFLAGSSTVELNDGVLELSDVVTFYHPTGEVDPAYRYVVDITKVQNIIYNLDLEFRKNRYNGVPLVLDKDVTTNPRALKPKIVKGAALKILKKLGLAALVADVAKSAKAMDVQMVNSRSWTLDFPVFLSGNSNVRKVNLKFGFVTPS